MDGLYTVILGWRGGRSVNLYYRERKQALAEFDRLAPPELGQAEDSFGTIVRTGWRREGDLEVVIFQDVVRCQDANIEIGLITARAQARANTRAQHDPQLNFAAGKALVPGRMG